MIFNIGGRNIFDISEDRTQFAWQIELRKILSKKKLELKCLTKESEDAVVKFYHQSKKTDVPIEVRCQSIKRLMVRKHYNTQISALHGEILDLQDRIISIQQGIIQSMEQKKNLYNQLIQKVNTHERKAEEK